MVEKAHEKGLYDALVVAELTAWLEAAAPAGAELILAADVLVYVGDPVHVMAAAAEALAPGAASSPSPSRPCRKAASSEGFVIGADARFAHARSFLAARAEAAGLNGGGDRGRLVALRRGEEGCGVRGGAGAMSGGSTRARQPLHPHPQVPPRSASAGAWPRR